MTAPTVAPWDAVTTALLRLLEGAGRPIFDGVYGGDPTAPPYWYGILYAVGGGDSDALPDLDGVHGAQTGAWQVSCVGSSRTQAQAAARILTGRVLARTADGGWAHPLTLPPPWQVVDRRLDDGTPGVDRQVDPPRTVFVVPARLLLTCTTSATIGV